MLSREKVEYITERFGGTEITSSGEKIKDAPANGFLLRIYAPGKLGRHGLTEIWFGTTHQARNAARELGIKGGKNISLPIEWEIKNLKNIEHDKKPPTLFELDEPGKDTWVGDYEIQPSKPFKEEVPKLKNKYPNLFELDAPDKKAKLNILVNRINKYAKICNASILSDMAKRTMVEILPIEKRNEVVLRTAAEGRKKVIEYGVAACVQEMSLYSQDEEDKQKLHERALTALDAGDYRKSLQFCMKGFANRSGWIRDNGGVLWLKIGKVLERIINLDEKLESTTTPEEKKKLYGEILVELNTFDGLSHNSASILYNILRLENEKYDRSEEEFQKEFNKTIRLRDTTELTTSPKTKWNEVKDILNGVGGSGTLAYSDNPYRGTAVSKEDEAEVEKQLGTIRLKKSLKLVELSRTLEERNKILDILTNPNIDPKSELFKLNLVKIKDMIYEIFIFFTSLKHEKHQIENIEKIRKLIIQNSTLLIELRDKLLLKKFNESTKIIRNNSQKLKSIFNEIQGLLLLTF